MPLIALRVCAKIGPSMRRNSNILPSPRPSPIRWEREKKTRLSPALSSFVPDEERRQHFCHRVYFASLCVGDQQTRAHWMPRRAASLSNLWATCPTPTAQWCAGPWAFHWLTKTRAPRAKRYRLLVLPISRIGPGTDSPSATRNFNRPSAVGTTESSVTGPCLTDISTDSPRPALP